MVEIIINEDITKIKINDIEIYIKGDYEIKKKEPAVTGSTETKN